MFELFVSKYLSRVPVNPVVGEGGLLEILGGSVLPGSPNPEPISDQKI